MKEKYSYVAEKRKEKIEENKENKEWVNGK